MADLLNSSQRADIKSALKDVADTFHKKAITVIQKGKPFDRWNEDREKPETETEVQGMIEYETLAGTLSQKDYLGELDADAVIVTFNFEDLQAANLTEGNLCVIDDIKDLLKVDGVLFEIDRLSYDGYIDETPILAVLHANKQEEEV